MGVPSWQTLAWHCAWQSRARHLWRQRPFLFDQCLVQFHVWHPTRFGLVTYSFKPASNGVAGSISLKPSPGAVAAKAPTPEFSVRIRTLGATEQLANVHVQGATLV